MIGLAPFAFVTATTSYVLLCSFNVILGLGMGLAMMPTMTAAMQAVPREAIARISSAMNIIRQGGASIGTAVMTVMLSTAIKDRIPIARVDGGNGFAALQHLGPAAARPDRRSAGRFVRAHVRVGAGRCSRSHWSRRW